MFQSEDRVDGYTNNTHTYICIYMYIYMLNGYKNNTHTYICIYMYIYMLPTETYFRSKDTYRLKVKG